VAKFREVTLTGPKGIKANTLNLRPIFEFSLLTIGGKPLPQVICVSKPWSNLTGQYPLTAERKLTLGGG